MIEGGLCHHVMETQPLYHLVSSIRGRGQQPVVEGLGQECLFTNIHQLCSSHVSGHPLADIAGGTLISDAPCPCLSPSISLFVTQ